VKLSKLVIAFLTVIASRGESAPAVARPTVIALRKAVAGFASLASCDR